ncbi:unnamed protein product [Caretta caretta]
MDGQQSIRVCVCQFIVFRHDKLTAKRSPVNSSTPPEQEAQAESTGEHQLSTHGSEDTMVSRSKYVDVSWIIHVAEVA